MATFLSCSIERPLPKSIEAVIVRTAVGTSSAKFAATALRGLLPKNWFIYVGGSHVAIHRKSGGPRFALLEEPRL